MTYQQAFRIFLYSDWLMLIAALVALSMAIIWAVIWLVCVILPRYKGRRRQAIHRSLIGLLVFAIYFATQMSITYVTFEVHPTSLLDLLSAFPTNLIVVSPIVVMAVGLVVSILYGIRSVLYRFGAERRRGLLKAVLGVVIFCLGAAPHTATMLIPVLVVEDNSNHEGTLARSGDPVPDFELATLDGAPFNTAELRGRVIVLNFFATWCGPCQMELPQLETVWDEFKSNRDFRMLVVGRKETDDAVRTFRKKRGLTFPMASDPHGAICGKFATNYIPRTFLISRQGTIIHEWTGNHETEVSNLRKLLRRELAEK